MKVTPIYEDRQEHIDPVKGWRELMTDEQVQRGQYYLNEYMQRSAEIAVNKPLWDRLSDLYACQREAYEADPDYPNSFVPYLTPTIEGQVASIIEADIEFKHVSDNPSQQGLMVKFDAASDYIRRKNKFMLHFKDYARFYDLYGNCWLTVNWDKSIAKKKGQPNGIARLYVPPLLSVMIDGRIKDYKDLQYAEYIIHEIGFQSLEFARKEYGDEYAEALSLGGCRYDGTDPDVSIDDSKSFTLLHVWTRNNKQGNLQLIEMDTTGLILRESDPSKPYYANVDNEYPFWFGRMIPIIGQFYGHGDGTILKPIQETANNLMDEMELAARFSAQSKIAIDPKAQVSATQFTSNPADPIICKDPNNNIRILQAGGINNVVPLALEFLGQLSQSATRFSQAMTGNQQGVSATATQVTTQIAQGNVGIKDKKSDIAAAMEWADRYCLKLCIEKWDKPFWANVGTDYAEYVDPATMLKAPAIVPLTGDKMDEYLKMLETNPDMKIPEYEEVYDDYDQLVMTDIDFETKVIMAPGIAKDSNSMYNRLLGLAQMTYIGEDGMTHYYLEPKRFAEMMEQLMGFKMTSESTPDMSLENAQQNGMALNQLNPIGNNSTVQVPTTTPNNLMGTMPQMPNRDNRGVIV